MKKRQVCLILPMLIVMVSCGSKTTTVYHGKVPHYTYGYMDTEGTVVIEPQYVLLLGTEDLPLFRDGLAYACVDGKYGYIDKTNRFVISPIYEDAHSFYNGTAWVKINGKWGLIDKNGNYVCNPLYDSILFPLDELTGVCMDWKWGYVDRSGKTMIEPAFDYLEPFTGDYAMVNIGFINEARGNGTIQFGLWGSIDIHGKEIVSPRYPYLQYNQNSLSVVRDYDEDPLRGYIDNRGMLVIDYKFTDSASFSEGFAGASTQKGNARRYGYINETGSMVIKEQFLHCGAFSEGLAAVTIDGKKYGYIDTAGKMAIEPQFDSAEAFSEGLSKVSFKTNGSNVYGYIDKTGAFVIEPQYIYAHDFSYGLAYVTTQTNEDGFINKLGETVIKLPKNHGAIDTTISEGLILIS